MSIRLPFSRCFTSLNLSKQRQEFSASADGGDVETYEHWRRDFARERLRTLYYLGLVANPVFVLSDILFYRDQLSTLILLRLILEAGFLVVFFAWVRQPTPIAPHIPLILWILIGNLCIAHMTATLGGFTSAYFNGLNLVFLAAAVIVPISWRAHLGGQIGTLSYYYGLNLLHPLSGEAAAAAIQNSFFLVWTCVACLFAVSLYEKLQTAEFQARLSERRTRQELEVSHRKLLELDKLKDQFFANISHEFRSPLTVALGAFKTLLKTPLPSSTQAVVQSGLRNTSRLLFLVNELLELARFDSGQATLRTVCIDLAALIKHVAANFELSDRKRIIIQGADRPLPVAVDVRKMTKVLYNLLTNAFKFSDPAKGTAWIDVLHQGSEVSIQIKDNGIGIPEDQLERIFERFTQVESDMTRRFEGSGIGLALAKEMVTLHGGTIAVHSTFGEGSTFTVTLPRGNVRPEDVVSVDEGETFVVPTAEMAEIAGVQESALDEKTDTGQPVILLVDDNPDMRAYLKRLLEDEYQVVSTSNGAEALEKARRLHPDLVLADIMMPVMSGYDLLCAIRSDQELRGTPVILLTAKAGTEARVESLEAGADDYVSKPFHEEELVARVKNQLRIHRQERELQARTNQLQELYSQLEKANAELQELSVRKSEFVSIVSHDLRTPLAAISVLVDNLLSGIGGPLNEKQLGYLDRINSNIHRMVRMITDLLDLAKIEAGTIHFHPRSVGINEIVETVVESLRLFAKAKSVNLQPTLAADCVVHGDPDKLSQVLTNLVHNACKFTPRGGDVRLEVSHDGPGFVRICVADTGCGIPADELPRVFDKFFRGSSSAGEARGAGLGLAIVKHFVELHHGRIWVESIPSQGSRFYFTIPLASQSAS
ncbi:MAG TPA: ATP-binding protein [Nitrospira sp.]|nr:ATP-binding protein [Nitrospira sp.]